MNRFYEGWLETARAKAQKAGLIWNPDFCPETGKVEKSQRWGLASIIGDPIREHWLSNFKHVDVDMSTLGKLLEEQGSTGQLGHTMSLDWREFLQAAVAHELLVKRNKVSQAVAVARAVRTLSLCAPGHSPWSLSAEHVQRAYNVALRSGTSGKLAMNVVMVVRNLFDNEHLSDNAPLNQFAKPYSDEASRAASESVDRQKSRESSNHNVHFVRSRLTDRKSAERLPERRAFWELIRIIFTETPLTFTDRVRFGALKMQVLSGLRIGENMLIPADCLRWKHHFDGVGRPAHEKGGISRSLSLRYFALKQDEEDVGGRVRLTERFQDVPPIFEDLFLDIVKEISEAVAPLTRRLKMQTETGRLFPEYLPEALVSASEMYSRVAGSIRISSEPITDELLLRYRETHSPEALAIIRAAQEQAAALGEDRPVYNYWHSQRNRPAARDIHGHAIVGSVDYNFAYFKISDVEEFAREAMPTKLPDVVPFLASGGKEVFPHELLFLHPSRALIEGRDNGIIDIERYFSVRKLSPADLMIQLSKSRNSLFARYGSTPEDKTLSLISHGNRHLQHTEFFRLGVADTIITKRFGRRTTAQSYTYDHRSLAESLDAIDLPSSATAVIPERAHETVKMILAGKVRGPLVDEFLKIQATLGDDVAFEYLAAEADGLHVTPYGFCLSSFTVDPCPKHLQCFNGCRHLARTDNPEEQRALERLRGRTAAALAAAEASPARTADRKNQVAHAKIILQNIEAAIIAKPGYKAFPDGEDLSRPIGKPATIIDAALSDRRQAK